MTIWRTILERNLKRSTTNLNRSSMETVSAVDYEDTSFSISEDLVTSPEHKRVGISVIDFDGLLEPGLKVEEDPRGGCGGHMWPAGMVLAKYLLRQPQLNSLRNKNIIELGAGGGIVGLALALALQRIGNDERYHIRITDQDVMHALMRRNIALNNLPATSVQASTLDWGTKGLNMSHPDILLAADCVYFEPAFPLLLHTLLDLIGPYTVCYFCFKKRRKADLRFVKDLRKAFRVEDILDDPDREIWSREALFL